MAAAPELDEGLAWELLTSASAIRDWATVRHVASLLGMDLTGDDGVVEEDWGTVLVLYEEGGEERRYAATRTGPVTARVFQPSSLKVPQHMGDWIVFDAAPVDRPPTVPEERERFIFTFRLVHAIVPGGFAHSWLLDGQHPGLDGYVEFRDVIRAQGWGCWDVTFDDYEIYDSQEGDEVQAPARSKAENAKSSDLKEDDGDGVPGILILVATPKTVPVKELHRTLTELSQTWPGPLSWLALAKKAGLDVAHHKEIVDRYDL
jgi:hypothetical protein